jgi:hypothetical protein
MKNEIEDFITLPKHKEGKYWKWVWKLILFIVIACCVSLIYASLINAAAVTKQERLRQVQINNNIPQWQITFKKI